MKTFILFGFITCLTVGLRGQYGHEWIDHSNPNPVFKIKIYEDGLYRIDYNIINDALINAGYNLAFIDPADFQLFHLGTQQYIHIEGESDGTFNSTDYIEFFGKKNDGTYDVNLFDSPDDMVNPYYSLFTDTSSYYLTWEPDSLAIKVRLANIPNNVTNPPPPKSYYIHKNYREYHNGRQSGYKFPAGSEYMIDSRFVVGEGFTAANFNKKTKTYPFPNEKIYFASPHTSATVRFRVVNIFDQIHHLRFEVNDTLYLDTMVNGQKVGNYDMQVPLTSMNNGINDIFAITALGTGSSDRNAVGYIETYFPREFDFNNESFFTFNVTGVPLTNSYLEIANFNHQSADPVLYDFDNHQRLVGVIDQGFIKLNIPMMGRDSINLYLGSQAAGDLKFVDGLEEIQFIDYSKAPNQGDYIIISHSRLRMDGQGTDWIEEYRQYRSSSAGGGFNGIIVSIDQLYDQFSYGIIMHPLSIRNFIRFALDSFQVSPQHIFLIGKGYQYNLARTRIDRITDNLIPTFGDPGSDNLLAATDPNKITAQIPIGRLAAWSGEEVRDYYNKVTVLETVQQDQTDQSIANKHWMKNVLHFGGGTNSFEQGLFKSYLSNFETTIEAPQFGGQVTSFFKTSPDPIQYVQSQFLDSMINNGVSLMTFFGHSSVGSFDVNIDRPESYSNYGKYPVIISNGCFSGLVHGTIKSVSEDFVFEPDKGAIAFISSTYFGEAGSLNRYTREFYRFLSKDSYGDPIGVLMEKSAKYLMDTLSSNIFTRFLVEQQTLHGDPAIKINPHSLPDYAIEPQFIEFDPPIMTIDIQSFDVKINVHNLGRAIDTSFNIEVHRRMFNGEEEILIERVEAPFSKKTFTFTFQTDPVNGINQNLFDVTIDVDGEVNEITTMNNAASSTLFIESDDALPIYPYEFSIVTKNSYSLKASTADPLAPSANYRMEIDTSENFNSPIVEFTSIISSGGVISWDDPGIGLTDSVVYYWRVSPDDGSGNYKWKNSSFTYINGSDDGWNQAHYFQFQKDDYANIILKTDRKFHFVDDIKDIKIVNGVFMHWSEYAWFINGGLTHQWGCSGFGAGIEVAVFDTITGLPWNTADYEFGEVDCTHLLRDKTFQLRTKETSQREIAIDFFDSIPDGFPMLIFSFRNPQYYEWKNDSVSLGTNLFEKLATIGLDELDGIDTFPYIKPFVAFVIKGDPGSASVVVGDTETTVIDTTFQIVGLWDQGYVNSTIIGPSKGWQEVSWERSGLENPSFDESDLELYGVRQDGSDSLLFDNIIASDTVINTIDAGEFPYMRMTFNGMDDSLRTSPQLDRWTVKYSQVPEAVVNPNILYSFKADTLDQGEELQLSVAIENVSDFDMDSLLVTYDIIDNSNFQNEVVAERMAPLAAQSHVMSDLSVNTIGYQGFNILVLEVNPDNDQPEQYHFNNFAFIPFYINTDVYNPLLDVTFDGRHILDGDIVSAKPEILIRLKDENKYLALDDTVLIDVSLRYPDGFRKKIVFQSPEVQFTPADTGNLTEENMAEIMMTPTFDMDGTYQLIVEARDVSGNETANMSYRLSFEVVNQSMISNVLNYPNPFTSNTRFVFTLTGAEIPDYLKIQIMTVSGRIVKEIMLDELGSVYVGQNTTEYAWDGTDQYGDPLANGIYLYRVVASVSGQSIDHYANSLVDKYFKSGFGKMYLAR